MLSNLDLVTTFELKHKSFWMRFSDVLSQNTVPTDSSALRLGFLMSSAKFGSNCVINPYTIRSICYPIHTLSDPYAIWSIRYLIHTLSNPFAIWSICYLIHTLSDLYAIQSICYPIHMLSDPYAIRSIRYPIHSYPIHTLSDPYISDPYGCSSAEVPINLFDSYLPGKSSELFKFWGLKNTGFSLTFAPTILVNSKKKKTMFFLSHFL